MGEVNIDNDNAVELTELQIQLEAVEDKIIILVDNFKSGYECKECGGTGKIKSPVVEGAMKDCTACGGKGGLLIVPEVAKTLPTLGTVLSMGPKTKWMEMQKAFYEAQWWKIWIFKRFLKYFKDSDIAKSIRIRPGARVLFQPHVGTFIPVKGNIRLKVMRAHEPLCVLYGTDEASKDFIDFDVPIEERY